VVDILVTLWGATYMPNFMQINLAVSSNVVMYWWQAGRFSINQIVIWQSQTLKKAVIRCFGGVLIS